MRGGRVQVMNGESAGWTDNMNRDGLGGCVVHVETHGG